MPSRKTVLVVEDDADVRSLFRAALTIAGFQVTVVADGLDALRRIDSDPPSLVVLDLGLPSISGAVVRQELAAYEHTRNIPVVIVTGSPEKAQMSEPRLRSDEARDGGSTRSCCAILPRSDFQRRRIVADGDLSAPVTRS